MGKLGLKALLTVAFLSGEIFAWTSGNIQVDITDSPMDIKISSGGATIANITAFSFGTVTFTNITAETPAGPNLVLTLSPAISVTLIPVEGGIQFLSTNPPAVQSVGISLKDNQWMT